MRHRKQFHIEVLLECREFSMDKCDFEGHDKMCGFKHTKRSFKSQEQNFQVVADSFAPPAQESSQ